MKGGGELQVDIDFEVKKDSRGYIIIRKNGLYEQHSHIKSKNGVRLLINLIKSDKMPRSEYLQVSARRLLNDDEYARLKCPKPKYNNNPRR